MGFIEVAAIVGGLAAIMSLGVSIGVYITKIPAMQKEIDNLRDDRGRDRVEFFTVVKEHDVRIRTVEVAIEGMDTKIDALLLRSTANGSKLDQIFGLLAQRGGANGH